MSILRDNQTECESFKLVVLSNSENVSPHRPGGEDSSVCFVTSDP